MMDGDGLDTAVKSVGTGMGMRIEYKIYLLTLSKLTFIHSLTTNVMSRGGTLLLNASRGDGWSGFPPGRDL